MYWDHVKPIASVADCPDAIKSQGKIPGLTVMYGARADHGVRHHYLTVPFPIAIFQLEFVSK